MSYDISTVTFEFRFTGENAEQEATDFFEQIPAEKGVTEIARRINNGREPMYFVNTRIDMDASTEYVQAVLDAMKKYEPDSFD